MTYTTLNTDQNLIRVLHLSPAEAEDEAIRFRLTVVLLDENPQYEALSYAWGDIGDTCSAEVEGCSTPITANLHSALRHLRLQDQERILWIDALCINQSDLGERMHQVSRMSSIYGQASQVVVWLGESSHSSDIAMEFVRKLANDPTLHIDPSLDPSIDFDGLKMDSLELNGHMIRFFDLPWWKRTWTIQEFVLAQRLVFQCSRNLVSRETMGMASNSIWSHYIQCCIRLVHISSRPESGINITESLTEVLRLYSIIKFRDSSYNILQVITSHCKREVTDPRDKVYGMLGLGTGQYANLVEPDYTLSPEQVCEAVMVKSIERTRKLEFLSHLFEHENCKLPSFVPNWTGPFQWTECYVNRLHRSQGCSASLDMPAKTKLISHRLLVTRGVIFDNVIATSAAPINIYSAGLLEELHRLVGFEQSSEELYCHTSDSPQVALAHTLCSGWETFMQDGTERVRRLESSTALSRYQKLAAFLVAYAQAEAFDSEVVRLLSDIKISITGRRFIRTKKGYFGLGPQKCKKGDLVVVLAGGNVPYIIRPLSRASQLQKFHGILKQSESFPEGSREARKLCFTQCYTILGDSYVHGIMYGEVFELLNEAQRKLKDIVLL